MKKHIYADNAATTKLDIEAFEVMKQFLVDDYANASQPYSFSRNAKKAIRDARAVIAECIGASPEEIYFTSGGTESNNWAIKGFTEYGDNRAVITSEIEHHSILNACAAVEELGYPVAYLKVDKYGIIEPTVLEKMITSNTKLVSIMLVNNEIGTIEPIAQLAEIAHKYGAIFHTDAVQATGHIPINVNNLDVDILSASAHKFNGPKGIGFIYIKKGTKIKPYENGGSQEFGMRAGTENIASIVAMATALKNNCSIMREACEKIMRMEEKFISVLKERNVDFIRNGFNEHVPGNVSISIKNVSGEMLLHRLDLKGIYISTGSACDSINTQISHVIKAIKVPDEYAEGTIRISFGKYNSEDDAIMIANSIADIIGQ